MRHDTTGTILRDLGIRSAGIPLLIAALASLSALHRILDGGARPAGPAYLLAALGFLGATCGCALVALGSHVLDRIEVSERWRPRGPIGRPPSSDSRPAIR